MCLRVGRFGKPKCFDSELNIIPMPSAITYCVVMSKSRQFIALAEGERCDGDNDNDSNNGESRDDEGTCIILVHSTP